MISFFINYGELLVQLPVNPNNLKISSGSNNNTIQMAGGQEVTNIGYSKLKTTSIVSFFPMLSTYSFINTKSDFKEPQYYIDLFNEIKDKRKYVRLIITSIDINMLVTIESFDFTRNYGTDDVEYSISMKEYKEHTIKILEADNTTSNVVDTSLSFNNDSRESDKEIASNYTVKSGDSLWAIAKSLLGDGNRWSDIYNYSNNKSIIGNNPNLIYPGQILSIPN